MYKKSATAIKQLHQTKNQSINLTAFYNLKPYAKRKAIWFVLNL